MIPQIKLWDFYFRCKTRLDPR